MDEKYFSTQPRNLYYLPSDGILAALPSDEQLSQATEVRFDGLTSLAEVSLSKMSSLDKLTALPGKDKQAPKLSSLDGIERAPWLARLGVSRQDISNINPLSQLPNLRIFGQIARKFYSMQWLAI
ncbi:hypothetical protein [Leptospira interrogans]|uniref:hypothetical protein n=1 Tax=Leptospira interrogans TaxID=173 RepID=UPI000AF77406|nr:hypothetical protein [Leptospira interrogans]